jgi:hypothetical protein
MLRDGKDVMTVERSELLISVLKSKLVPAEDRQPKTRFPADLRRFAATAAAGPLF